MWRKSTALFISLVIFFTVQAQLHRARIWVFGEGVGLEFLKDSVKPKIDYYNSIYPQYEGTGLLNDSQGNLKFYIVNGNLINSKNELINSDKGLAGSSSSSQANIIASINDTVLHIFGSTSGFDYYYSKFNIISGKFEVKGQSLIHRASEAQAHVNHQNGHWQWVVSHSRLGDTLYSYLITDDGLETCPVISHAGPFYNDWYPGQGVMKFSADGKYLFVGAWSLGKVTICDFNNQTGLISEKFRIDITDSFPYGIETQGNNLFVSFNRPNDIIFQYSLKKMDYLSVMNSRKLLFDSSAMDAIGQLQLAPDGKIYVAVVNQSRLAFLDPAKNYKYSYTKNLFATKKCYGGFPNFNASYFHTPSLNFNYTRNSETNTFKFTATDTFAANNWQWKFTKGNILQTQSGKLITHNFTDTGNWLVRCIASNGIRNDTIIKTIAIQQPLQKQYLGEDILFAAGANVTGNLAVSNLQNPHCVHWQKLGDTAEKLGNTYKYNDTGTFICKATNSIFCNYNDTIKVRVCDSFARAAQIIRIGDSLVTHTYGAKYQWYKNDSVIIGATGKQLKLYSTGIYKLRTWNIAGCDSSSAAFEVNKLGVYYFANSIFKIYPNPNNGTFIIKSKSTPITAIQILDLTGKKIFEKLNFKSGNIEIKTELNSGVYLLRINSNYLQKIIIN